MRIVKYRVILTLNWINNNMFRRLDDIKRERFHKYYERPKKRMKHRHKSRIKEKIRRTIEKIRIEIEKAVDLLKK